MSCTTQLYNIFFMSIKVNIVVLLICNFPLKHIFTAFSVFLLVRNLNNYFTTYKVQIYHKDIDLVLQLSIVTYRKKAKYMFVVKSSEA